MMILVAFVWNATATIAGKSVSVALYVVFFVMAGRSMITTVAYLPYMATFANSRLMPPFFIGIGCGALLPAILALIQGRFQ